MDNALSETDRDQDAGSDSEAAASHSEPTAGVAASADVLPDDHQNGPIDTTDDPYADESAEGEVLFLASPVGAATDISLSPEPEVLHEASTASAGASVSMLIPLPETLLTEDGLREENERLAAESMSERRSFRRTMNKIGAIAMIAMIVLGGMAVVSIAVLTAELDKTRGDLAAKSAEVIKLRTESASKVTPPTPHDRQLLELGNCREQFGKEYKTVRPVDQLIRECWDEVRWWQANPSYTRPK